MDLTVAICTYKRFDLFKQTLESLRDCEPIDAAWELIIVDNEGNEEVRDLVVAMADEYKRTTSESIDVHYRHETNLGHSHARNNAIHAAKAPVILFTDDDVTFDPQWLANMWSAIASHDNVDIWGGRIEPVWDMERPTWFNTDRCPSLGDTIVRYQLDDVSREWDGSRDGSFVGANLALRIATLHRVGLFDTSVGHAGDKRTGGDDSLMMRTLVSQGGHAFYVADAIVHHPVPRERITRKYARGFAWRQGWTSIEIVRRGIHDTTAPPPETTPETKSEAKRCSKNRRVPRWVFKSALVGVFAGMASWLGGLVRFNAGAAFAGQFKTIFNFSKLWHAFKRA